MNMLPPPQLPTPPAAASRKPSAKVVGAFAAVAVVAAGGTFLLTRDDNAQPVVAPPSSTTASVTVPAPTSTVAPVVVSTSTTESSVSVTDTEPPPPETIVVPEGATELGYGVYVPAQDGLEVSGDDPFTFTHGANGVSTSLQVLNRDLGEDPNVLIQEYVDTFDEDYALIGYGTSTTYDSGYRGYANLRFTAVDYAIYVSDTTERNTFAKIYAVVRDDGLSLLADAYGAPGEATFSEATLDELVASLAAAPPVGEPTAWFPAEAMVPTSSSRQIDLPFPSIAKLTLAEGYEVTQSTSTAIEISDGSQTVAVTRLTGLADLEAAQSAALAAVGTTRSTTTTEAFTEATTYGTTHTSLAGWFGYDVDGLESSGYVKVVFDERSKRATVLLMLLREGDWNYNIMDVMTYGLTSASTIK